MNKEQSYERLSNDFKLKEKEKTKVSNNPIIQTFLS